MDPVVGGALINAGANIFGNLFMRLDNMEEV